jgi:hypothetical protein
LLLGRGELAVPVGGGHASVHQDVAAGDEPAVRAHEQCAHRGHLVGSAGAARRGRLDHAPVALSARAGELVLGQRRDDDAWTDRVDPRTTLAPANRLGHHTQRIAALRDLVGVQRIRHLVRLEEGKGEQLLHRSRGQCVVLLDAERGKPVPGLRRDDDARTPRGDDVAELLQHERGAVQVDLEDRRRRRLRR